MLPPFTSTGLLPPGGHYATWDEVVSRFGGTPRRAGLLQGLMAAAENLREAGVETLWLDGSFVTTKEDPTDWDGAWDPTHADFAKVDPLFLDRYDLMTGRHRQKAKYGGELLVGVETGSGKTFQQFFQSSIDGDPKGIVLLDLRTIP